MPAIGSADKIIMGWNGALLAGKLEKVGTFSITVEFRSKKDNFTWRCTSVYESNARAQKHSFWKELNNYGGDLLVPWVICGNFNAIFSKEDKP